MKKITNEQVALMHELREAGLYYRQIAEKIGCHRSTVSFHLNPELRKTHNTYSREWQRDNPDLCREYHRVWESNNPGVSKRWAENNSERLAELHHNKYIRYRDSGKIAIRDAKGRAAKLGIPFDSAIEQSLGEPPINCPMCDVVMERGDKIQPNTPSIDRNTPSLGYVPGNVCWMCFSCNSRKRDKTLDEWLNGEED